MIKILRNCIVLLVMMVMALGNGEPVRGQNPQIWKVQSVDTMKYSRDTARQEQIFEQIPQWVEMVASLGPSHMAVGTPYDEEFDQVLTAWVREARRKKMKVWFRGNFSGWEGWFDYPALSGPQEHHDKLKNFIINNPDLFENGDVFTPAPEPENGLIDDPRKSEEKQAEFLKFVVESQKACKQAFWKISKQVKCGYFSTNGDIARDILDKETVSKIGNVIAMDHYVRTPEGFGMDIDLIHEKYGVPIVLGELGAPIPDLHGELSEDGQAELVRAFFNELYIRKSKVEAVNYWVFLGGSTTLFNPDNSPRKAVEVIKDFYIPGTIKGTVRSTTGKRLAGIKVSLDNGMDGTVTDHKGSFELVVPAGDHAILIQDKHYQPVTYYQSVKRGTEEVQEVELTPVVAQKWWQQLWLDILEKFRF